MSRKKRSTFIAIERRTIRDYAKAIGHMYDAMRYWNHGERLARAEQVTDL